MMNMTVNLQRLLGFARQHSNYYEEHFRQIPKPIFALADLPLVDVAQYWQGSHDLDQWPVLTAPIESSLVFRTGGTTGTGKLSVFTRDEWQTLVTDFGTHLTAQLNTGDRIANLFFVGDLYASFTFIHDALAHVDVGITEFPFTGNTDPSLLADSIIAYRINVLVGVPAQLLTFAAWLERQSRTLEGIQTLLYGGESLFDEQLQMLARLFPNARIASIGYASVDAGLIGTSERDCALGEHRMLEHHSVLEIIDELSGDVIEECDRTGLLVMTNLTRQLMPLIRYPVGDLARWCEPQATPRRKFALMGRSMDSQRVRVSILTLMTNDIDEIVQRTATCLDWQLVIEQLGPKDVLTVKWVPQEHLPDSALTNTALRNALIELYPLIAQLTTERQLELHVSQCRCDELIRHPRSGKRQRVVDLRVYTPAQRSPTQWIK
jgi:phenylacetate-CoA ligase